MRAKLFGIALAAVIAGVLQPGCANEAKVAADSPLGGNSALIVNAAAAGTIDISSITWVEDCYLRAPGIYGDSTMILRPVGTRTESEYSDSTCTAQTGTDTFALNVTNDGNKTTVNWVDDMGNPVAPPAGFGATVSATKVTLSGTQAIGAFSFKTLLIVNDLVSPMILLSGDEESVGAPLDLEGYPDNIFTGGPFAQ